MQSGIVTSYDEPETIRRVFAALQGAHSQSRRTRLSAVFCCSLLLPVVACMVTLGALEAFASHRIVAGLAVGGASLTLLAYAQRLQWVILKTRFAFSPDVLSQTRPRSRSWTLDRKATSCIELHSYNGQPILRALDSEGKPHLVQLTPSMKNALIAAQLWPAT